MNKKVYIIEDDANTLHGLKANLSHEGFVVEADQGQEERNTILNKTKLFKPDIIILDLVLPAIDGFELLYNIKASEDFNKTKVFIFTNHSDEDTKKRCEDLGINYYFLKSEFNINEFAQKVKKIINNLDKI